MKICVAQTRPITGDIHGNIEQHKNLIDLAVGHGADTVIFPELSLTGYEPALAKALATTPDDHRLDDFQKIADARQITVGVGLPTKNKGGICISMIIFHPHQARQIYSKKYLHADEEPFFVSGQNALGSLGDQTNVALAICYELSVPDHAETAFHNGADIYVASVAKTAKGVAQAGQRLAEIARSYAMTVFMANCLGPCDGADCAGQSAVWNKEGRLVDHLDGIHEGLIIFDPDTQELIKQVATTPPEPEIL